MTDSASQQLEQWLAAERERPDPSPERAEQVWSGVESRLAGTTAAPPWAPAAGRPLWPWLIAGVVALVTAGGLLAGPSDVAAQSFERGSEVALSAPTPARPRIELAALQPPVDAEPAANRPAKQRGPAAKPPGFAKELALIERGRKALAAKQPAKVLTVMREHRKTFPKGALREEAAALRTAATCAGRDEQTATKAVAQFEQRWARSVHADLVRRHCR